MKITIIAPSEIPARRANTLQVMKMTQALAGLGHNTQLLVPHASRAAPPNWADLAQHYGLQQEFPVEWLPVSARLRRYDFGLRAVLHARHQQADLIYTRLPQAAAIASTLGLRTILEVHDLPQGSGGPWLFRRFLAGKGARRLVVITRALASDLASQFDFPGQEPFTLVAPDGVDLERYQQLPEPATARQALAQTVAPAIASRLQPGGFTAGYTGHLYAGRGADLLLDIAAGLPEMTFLIVGGEPQHVERFQQQIARRGLQNLAVTGFVPNARLSAYQAACEALLMPYQQHVEASSGGDISRYLSPMKLFEYLACGRPILSSNLPVLQEVLNPQNAILLPGDDPRAWIEALHSLQNDPQRQAALAEQARQAARHYTWSSRAARIIADLDILERPI